METPEAQLMARIRARDAGAFEELAARHRAPLRRCLAATVRDPAAAEDLLQEALLRLWTRADTWDGSGGVKAWLFRIATNLAVDHLRARRRLRERPLELPADTEEDEDAAPPAWMIDAASLGPDDLTVLAERRESLRRLVDGLPEEKREVFRLVHEAEMEMHEVAERLGIPEGTVKSRLHYAKKHLARHWKEE